MSVSKDFIKQAQRAGELLRQEHAERLRLEKVAADLQKEARAQKIAFREVELGCTEPFRTHEEFQQKVASLMREDLDVVEKALDLGYGSARRTVGELDATEAAGKRGKNPFEHFVLTGELEQ